MNEDGFREVLGAAEGMKEDKASWVSFFQWLRGRGLDGVKLIVGDKCMGMLEAVGEVFPDTKYQIRYNKGPVDKSKNSAETHSGSSRTVDLEIAKDGILPSA